MIKKSKAYKNLERISMRLPLLTLSTPAIAVPIKTVYKDVHLNLPISKKNIQ